MYSTSQGRTPDAYNSWNFQNFRDFYDFINADNTAIIYLSNIFAIGRRQQEDTYITLQPVEKVFLTKPKEFPEAKLSEEDSKYRITYFDITKVNNVDKRKRVYLTSNLKPNSSDINIKMALNFNLKKITSSNHQTV